MVQVFLFLAAVATMAQTTTSHRSEFAVTSVKSTTAACCSQGGVGNGKGGGRVVTLKMLMATAYRVQQFQISGGPGWIDSDRFDVEGKADDLNASFEQLRLMLQSLLEDRFQLKLHRETREASVYTLVVAKDGPRIKLSSDQTSPDLNGPVPAGAGPGRGAIRIGAGSLIGNAATLALFSRMLSQRLDRMVIDKTGLTGRYDFQLKWTPDGWESNQDPAGNPLPSTNVLGASVFTAIQEQMGLKLAAARSPVEVLVVDHAERPAGN